jgi:hypothetical protein
MAELIRSAIENPSLADVFTQQLHGAEARAFLAVLQDALDRRALYAPLLTAPAGPQTHAAKETRFAAAQRLMMRLADASGELPYQLFVRTVLLDGLRPRYESGDGTAEVYKGTSLGVSVALKCVRVPVGRAGYESEAFNKVGVWRSRML